MALSETPLVWLMITLSGSSGRLLTSEALPSYIALYSGDTLVLEERPESGTLAEISGITGASWPKGVAIEQTAVGTMVGFSW